MSTAGALARRAGGGVVAGWIAPRDSIRIPLAHAVFTEDLPRFEGIARYLLESRRPLTPSELFAHYRQKDVNPVRGRSFIYSFDDGLRSSYEATVRVLDPLGIKAMFFVPTRMLELETPEEMRQFAWERLYLGRLPIDSLRSEDYLMMGVDELRDLQRRGHAVFPHTHSHAYMSDIQTQEDVERELIRPKEIVEDILQARSDAFAFPIGTDRVMGAYAYRRIGEIYSYCFTALMGPNTTNTHPLLFHRDAVHPWFADGHVRNIFDGLYDPYHHLKMERLRRGVGLPRRLAANASAVDDPVQVETNGHQRGQPGSRDDFISAVARTFEGGDVEYVVLHGFESAHRSDSDVDIAVAPRSRRTVDALIRTGVLGRVIQCLHYADPWSHYYVLETNEPGRRFRQLDVVCDPWGISRDGPAIRTSLAHPAREAGIRVTTPAARTLYLSIKRARKRRFTPEDVRRLASLYEQDPARSDELLEEIIGAAGTALASAMRDHKSDISDELDGVRNALRRKSLRPDRLLLRAYFTPRRLLSRFWRPTGAVVVLAGPDGTGKTTLASALQEEAAGMFRRIARLHLRPGILPAPARLLGREPRTGLAPHRQVPSGSLGSVLRLTYLWLDTVLGWGPKIGLPRIRTSLVILERGWLDLAVDPIRYRLSSPRFLATSLAHLQPRPDLVLRLDAPSAVIRQRKPELEISEIDRQLTAWKNFATDDPRRFGLINAGDSAAGGARQAVDLIANRLADRQRSFEECALALFCLGGLRTNGRPYTIVSVPRWPARPQPRWLLPAGLGSRGPSGARLYRPAQGRHRAGALFLELIQRAGANRPAARVAVDPDRGLAPILAAKLGKRSVVLAAAATGDHRRGERALLSVWSEGEIVGFAKVARKEAGKLHHEAQALTVLASVQLNNLVVPEIIDCFDWHDCTVLVLKPFRTGHRADRALSSAELAGLAELQRLAEPLRDLIGTAPGQVLVHGDFAPWNCSPLGNSSLALWDWEESRLGLPLEDLWYWRLQRFLRFGHGSALAFGDTAREPDAEIRTFCEQTGVDPAIAPEALSACLERRFGTTDPEVLQEHLNGARSKK